MELRQSPRFPVHCPLSFSAGEMCGVGTLVNLSSGGWMVTSDRPVPPGTHLTLHVLLPDLDQPLDVEDATVQWAYGQTFGLKPICMGIAEWKRLRRFSSKLLEASVSRF